LDDGAAAIAQKSGNSPQHDARHCRGTDDPKNA
jgi:hypothetical protein